mmetsp:Transcript_13092/g.34690  ORF Transcript_13092/g.34690 Transcript_13092/m.34690 type:complete len:257 (-) Transcript_13092:19-789(-)
MAAVAGSLPRCIQSSGQDEGPCAALPISSYVDLPGGSVYPLCAFLWHLVMPRSLRSRTGWRLPLLGVFVAIAMEVWGFPSTLSVEMSLLAGSLPMVAGLSSAATLWSEWATPSVWWVSGKAILALSLSCLCCGGGLGLGGGRPGEGGGGAADKGDGMAPGWLAALDRLSLGVCIVHVRVLEFLVGYLRPGGREFSWDACILDYLAVWVGSLTIASVLYLMVQAPAEASVRWCIGVASRLCLGGAAEAPEPRRERDA